MGSEMCIRDRLITSTFSERPLQIQLRSSNDELLVSNITATDTGDNTFSTEEKIFETKSSFRVLLGIPRIPSVPKYCFNFDSIS